MNKKITILVCLFIGMVWLAGCSCPGVRPVAAPPPVVAPAPPPPPQPEVVKPTPPEPVPSKKLKKRVVY